MDTSLCIPFWQDPFRSPGSMLIFLEILAVAVPFSRRLKLGGGFNPFEKYWPNWIISPSSGENQKYLKPLARVSVVSKANGRNSVLRIIGCKLLGCCLLQAWVAKNNWWQIRKTNQGTESIRFGAQRFSFNFAFCESAKWGDHTDLQTFRQTLTERQKEWKGERDATFLNITSPNRYFLFQASADWEAVLAFCRRAAYCRVSKRKLRCDSDFTETHMRLIKRTTNKAFVRDRSRMVASSSRFFVSDLGNRGRITLASPKTWRKSCANANETICLQWYSWDRGCVSSEQKVLLNILLALMHMFSLVMGQQLALICIPT